MSNNNGGTQAARPSTFKTLAAFAKEYVPLSYTIEPIVRSSSLYTVSARTGGGKTALFTSTALAVASGRPDILGCEVTKGRVAFLAGENPDDLRMRLTIAAHKFSIDRDKLLDAVIILDQRDSPESIIAGLKLEAEKAPFQLVLMDSFAAYFDGRDINDNVLSGQFTRRLRPITQIAGLPSVMVAANPTKNAGPDQLIPYGGGAILNEVDGNLTTKFEDDAVELHWQGKLRGLEFKPLFFRFENHSCDAIKDTKGRQVAIPTLVPLSNSEIAIRIVDKKEAKRTKITAAMKIALKALDRTVDDLPDDYATPPGLPPGAVAVSVEDWRQWAYRLNISTGELRAQQKAFKGATESLNASGDVVFLDDLAWRPIKTTTYH